MTLFWWCIYDGVTLMTS